MMNNGQNSAQTSQTFPNSINTAQSDEWKLVPDPEPVEKTNRYGCIIQDVEGDGNCFFYALAHQYTPSMFNKATLTASNHMQLRQRAAQEIQTHASHYFDFIPHETYEKKQAYIRDIGTNKVWVGDDAAQAMARALKITIVIISSQLNMPPQVFKPKDSSGKIIVLGHSNDNHYQSLVVLDQRKFDALRAIIGSEPSLEDYPATSGATAAHNASSLSLTTSLEDTPLQRLKRVFQAEFGDDFSKLPNRDNTLFFIVQHGFPSIQPMMEVFLGLGISPDQVFMTTKPHTTPDDMLKYFSKFIHYTPFQWTTAAAISAQSDTQKRSYYKILTDETHKMLFDNFFEYLRYPGLPNRKIENIVIVDEGGKFIGKFIDYYHLEYSLELMSPLPTDKQVEAARIYVNIDNATINYKVKDPHGVVQEGAINANDFGMPIPGDARDLLLKDILTVTSGRAHTLPGGKAAKPLKGYHIVAIEHTKCGTYRPELRNLPFPLINMADSYLKTRIESEFIAKSMFVHLNVVLQKLMLLSPITIGVVGGGDIGKEVLCYLSQHYSHISIKIFDIKVDMLSSEKIHALGWKNVIRENSIESIFQHANVILGCTGKDFMANALKDCFSLNSARKIHLISCSSGDNEFNTLLQKMPGYQFTGLNDVRDYTMPLDAKGEKSVILYNGGFPMNFLIQEGIPVDETVPLHEVQITRSMKLAAIVQALKLLEVTPYVSKHDDASLKDYMKLDVIYQWEIIQSFYKSLMQDNPHEKASLAIQSMGVDQPSMKSVLNNPYYITTDYQIRMQGQLSKQTEPIKTLVIHGTTGSGKTTLALHYHHKRKMQYPQHLSRIISAETITQWKSSLREWAEELCPELKKLLKEEQDPEKQERLIKQRLREQLQLREWCVVIDNWDENEVGIQDIEEIFTNLHQNNIIINKGVLLITTQSQSPYLDHNQSLDLSSGLLLKESQALMMNIINVGGTSINLGNEQALQSLISLLESLPLALVIAASYLRWENEFRDHSEGPFTYEKYIEMLAEPVSKLDAEYDKLKNKGLIPRDLSRKEFRRIKTQEAAVGLSLEKAIRSTSGNPNMLLWKVLCFCGFLASDGIPQQLLKYYLKQECGGKNEEEISNNLINILESAQRYSLLQYEVTRSVIDNLFSLHIHRVIQKVLRDNYWPKLLEHMQNITFSSMFSGSSVVLQLLLEAERAAWIKTFFPDGYQFNLKGVREGLEHGNCWLSHMNTLLLSQYTDAFLPSWEASLHRYIGEGEVALAHYSSAKSQLKLALMLYNARNDEDKDYPRICKTLNILGNAYRDEGDYVVALDYCKQAEEIIRTQIITRSIYADHGNRLDIAATLSNIGATYLGGKNYNSALNATQQALQMFRDAYNQNPNHSDIISATNNLGAIFYAKNEPNTALDCFAQALTMCGSPDNANANLLRLIAFAFCGLAKCNNALKNYLEAHNHYIRALGIYRTIYREEHHPEIGALFNGLGNVYLNEGKYPEARHQYTQALIEYHAIYGENSYHPHIEAILTHIDKTHFCEENYDNANVRTQHINTLMSLRIAHVDDFNHADITKARNDLVAICMHEFDRSADRKYGDFLFKTATQALTEKKYEKTIQYYECLMSLNIECLYHNNACAYHLLGIQKKNTKCFTVAEILFKKAIAIEAKLNTQVEYANFLRACGEYDKALELLNQIIEQPISQNSVGLSYSPGEAPALPQALAEKVYVDGEIIVDQMQIFAYYLKIYCLLEQSPIFDNELAESMSCFENLVNQHRNNTPFLPIYDWLLNDVKKMLETDIEKIPHTLFQHGYRFSMIKTEKILTVTREVPKIESAAHRYLLENMRRSFQAFLSSTLTEEVVTNSTANSFTLEGSPVPLTLGATILNEFSQEVSKENNEFCRIM